MQAANKHYELLSGAVIVHVFAKNFAIKTYGDSFSALKGCQ
jgi:hypothetical protein